MRIWFDTEFIETGATRPLDLLSIGLVREDGRELYLENKEADWSYANEWVRANVLPKLQDDHDVLRTRKELAAEILAFAGDRPEFWGYYADYDWVLLCQLFGTMDELPEGWPMFCRDFVQLIEPLSFQLQKLPEHQAHNALLDAKWLRGEHMRFEETLLHDFT